MREIGSLSRSSDPAILGDYLLARGITSRIVESPAGWTVWVHNEDQLRAAAEALEAYRVDPSDPRFAEARAKADSVRRAEREKDRVYEKNQRRVVSAHGGWHLRRRPLTALSMAVCIAVYFAGQLSDEAYIWQWNRLTFFPPIALNDPTNFGNALEAIRQGEYWRLFTPALLHINLVHLIFNMWATSVESTAIEYTRGTLRLALIVVVSAVVSNLGQFYYAMLVDGRLHFWGGYSGVLYALFGYIWMKSRFEPQHGMIISDSSVRTMLLWLMLGFIGLMPMANGAHVAGLVVGILFGLARF